jgi:hypothetical protein
VSLLGEVTIPRSYYHCRHCGDGHFPWDGVLRLTPRSLTPGAEEVVSLAGITDAFGAVAERTLRKMTGLCLSESTVQRTTESAGRRLGEHLKSGGGVGEPQHWDWHRDAQGKTCAYVSLDATGVMMQGPKGVKVEGRMAYVGMIFNPQPRQTDDDDVSKPCDGVRYLAGHYTLDELGQQLRCQAKQVGMEAAEQWVALTDGGNGLEPWTDVHFPRAAKILDFRHATEYLADLAQAIGPAEASPTLLTTWCHTMKHEGGAGILQVLDGLDRRRMTKAARHQHDKTTNYIRKNVGRMDYPDYLRRGWQIATGAVESACKRVVNRRLCAGGMRWCERGSDDVCHLRALFNSDADQWDAFWCHPTVAT